MHPRVVQMHARGMTAANAGSRLASEYRLNGDFAEEAASFTRPTMPPTSQYLRDLWDVAGKCTSGEIDQNSRYAMRALAKELHGLGMPAIRAGEIVAGTLHDLRNAERDADSGARQAD